MALLNGRRVTDLDGAIAPAGGYRFDVRLDSGDPPAAGPATLKIGDLPIIGRILPDRGGLDAPALPALVFACGWGWRTRLAAGAYKSPNGVRLSTVLADIAAAAGEMYDAPAECKLGPEYGWTAGTPARAVLADLVVRGAIPMWRVEPTTGRAVFSAWPSRGAADAHGVIQDRALAQGARHVALVDNVAAWLPGATVQGQTIARLVLHEHDSTLSAEVWTS